MKIFHPLAAAMVLAASSALSAAAGDVRVMSFNVRYDNSGDGANGWAARSTRVAALIDSVDADIVGTQEVLHHQFADLKKALPGYAVVGCGREDGKEQGEYAALWYKSDRFDCLDCGNFWLSATPDVAGSMGWDGACVRMASWALLRDKTTGEKVVALNTHLDHVGVEARHRGVELIKERLAKLAPGVPAVVTGDFNSGPESAPVLYITDPQSKGHRVDSRTIASKTEGPAWTFHDFGRQPVAKREIIDFVFVSPGTKVKDYIIIDTTPGAPATCSDHCPVVTDLEI